MQEELTKALEVLIENDVDMILVEYFFYIQEMEWAIELCRKVLKAIFMTKLNSEFAQYNKPIAATMAIGPKGDRSGISAGECAVRSASELRLPKSKFFPTTQDEQISGWQRQAQTLLGPTASLTLGSASRR